MQKSVYHTAPRSTAAVAAPMGAPTQAGVRRPAPAAAKTPERVGRPALLALAGCLALAVMTVLFVPLMVGGATASSTAVTAAAQPARSAVGYASVQQAVEDIGLAAVLPKAIPEGYSLTACNVVDGSILELEYGNGKASLLFRTAAGSDDLSGADMGTYSFTATETVEDVARGYAGVSEKKYNLAVWAHGGNSYAILSADGLEAEVMRTLAESVA